MPLPNLNQGGNQSPAQSPPGANPNNRPRQVENSPGVFKTWANNMATTVSENISPSNFIRQGTYNAFGNNAVTRTAMGFMDNSLDAL
ncbi:MAG TPA: hypothetical protein VFM18_03875, partial [Methanosarcina sp.]|nr:hypothetical protein [Methanosarcina sp.]